MKLALAIGLIAALGLAGEAGAATITGVVPGGTAVPGPNVVVGAATAASLTHAEVGLWTGEGRGAAEPVGVDRLTVNIEVGSGGQLDFDYSVLSVDGCYYDPIRIYVQTPSELMTLYECSGDPPPNEFHAGGTTGHATLDLTRWAKLKISLVVEQTQEGTWDQSQTVIDNLVVTSPPVTITLGTPQVSPARLLAGRAFMVRVPLVRSDGQIQTSGTVSCKLRVGTTRITPVVGRIANGIARCTAKLPVSAKHRLFVGSITVQINQYKPLSNALRLRVS